MLGFIGLFLPLLPTTPFMLLAGLCYCRSSERMYLWLLSHPRFGFKLYSFNISRSISMLSKWRIWVALWFSLGLSMLLVPSLWIRCILVVVGFGVSTYIGRLKTLRADQYALQREAYTQFIERLRADNASSDSF